VGRFRGRQGWGFVAGLIAVACLCGVTAVAADPSRPAPQQVSEPPAGFDPRQAPGASAAGLASLAKLGERAVEESRARREWLRSGSAIDQRAASRGAYADATAAEAEALVEGDFADLVTAGTFDVASISEGALGTRFLDDYTLRVDRPGTAHDVIVDSPLALRATDDAGRDAPVDLGLRRGVEGFAPANPLVDVMLPETLDDGASVGGVAVYPKTDGAPIAHRVEAVDGVLYHEAVVDTDALLVPVPTGLEAAWILRSPQAPAEQRLRFALPEGGALQAAPDGGVDLVHGEERLGRVLPPLAVDAQGEEVGVSYGIDGATLVVRVDHREEDIAYPVLVDPVIEDWLGPSQTNSWYHGHNYDGIAQWYWHSNQSVYGQPYAPRTDCFTPVSCYKPAGMPVPPYGRGLYVYVFPHPQQILAGKFGEWVYDPPGTTTQVTQAVLGPSFSQRRGSSVSPYFFLGIWASGISDWTAITGYPTIDLLTPNYTTLNAGSHQPNSGANVVSVGYFAPSTVTLSSWRDFGVGGARITLTDPEVPTVADVGQTGPTEWTSSASFTVAPTATDPGLGVKSLTLTVPKAGGSATQTRTHGCTGRRANACPASWTLPSGATTAFSYTTADADPVAGGAQPVPEGVNTVSVVAKDILDKSSSAATATVKVDRGAPGLDVSGALWDEREADPPPAVGVPMPDGIHDLAVDATDPAAGPAPQGTRAGVVRVEVEVDGQSVEVDEGACPAGNCARTLEWDFDTAEHEPGRHTIEVTAIDGAGNVDTAEFTVFVAEAVEAPPLPETGTVPIGEATEFIYTGPDPMQTGVAPGTIEAERAAVVRGLVRDRGDDPVEGVLVSVPDHPEYGSSTTSADGEFYLAVNGGELLDVRLEKAGYLPVDRQVDVPWQDYVWIEDAVLTPLDPIANEIDLSTPLSPAQVAQGSVETDADGTRQATLVFQPDTSAEMVMPNGTEVPLDELTVRATEYTVGANGQAAMPAELPPTSGYTYAAEYSVDEAIAAGAKEVRFSRPVANYTDNFLDFPVGSPVPTGHYDRDREAWVSAPNGVVVEIHSEVGGAAVLDVTGSGQPATTGELQALGVTPAELEELASLYDPGDSLWRVLMDHFTPWDHNWPWGLPPDAEPPELELEPPPVDESCTSGGSVIECENQVLGEDLALTGTEHTLHYRSGRVPGRVLGRAVDIPLSGSSIPSSLQRIELKVEIAGQKTELSFAPAPNLSHRFVWDGLDSFGRQVNGAQPVTVDVDYVYAFVRYQQADLWERSFARVSGRVLVERDRGEARAGQVMQATLSAYHQPTTDLAGWSIGAHHRYDPVDRVLYMGDGRLRSAENVGLVADRFAGEISEDAPEASGDGGPARDATFAYPEVMDVGPDGSVYFADSNNARIRKITPDGTIETIAGTGEFRDYGTPDGLPATETAIDYVMGLDVAPDGSVYFSEWNRISKIDPDGIVRTVAGNEIDWDTDPHFSGDGGPAVDANLRLPDALSVAPDGSLYFSDYYNDRIRHVGTDGIITTVAGTGVAGFSGDGGPADQAQIDGAEDVEVGPDGSVYVVDDGNERIRKIGTDGVIETVAGGGPSGPIEYGIAATEASISPANLTVDPDGTVYFADYWLIYKVDANGILRQLAGNDCSGIGCGDVADGTPAAKADLGCPAALAIGQHDVLYATDTCWHTIRRVAKTLPEFDASHIRIPSEDGRELYEFDQTGRHLRTVDLITAAPIYTFSYDSAGRLTGIEDGDGLDTTIERDPQGAPTAIVAPFGRRTDIGTGAGGYLDSLTNPASEETAFGYGVGGLLTSMETPEGRETTFTYDSDGRLTRDTDPAGGYKELLRNPTPAGADVTLRTKLGRETRYEVERLAGGSLRRRWTGPSGTQRTALLRDNSTMEETRPDGVVQEVEARGDDRFGMQTPVSRRVTTETPGGKLREVGFDRDVVQAHPLDPFDLAEYSESVEVNGKTATSIFDLGLGEVTSTSPEGRDVTTNVDVQRRPTQRSVPGMAPISYGRDALGRLESVTQGARSSTFQYDALGRLETATDSLDRVHSFEYDGADRLVGETLPDAREIAYAYDDDGNLESVTPPSRPEHAFSTTPAGLRGTYTPPDLGSAAQPTLYEWSDDRELTKITKPGGREIDFGYDAGGRLHTVTQGRGTTTVAYHPQTGNPASVTAPGGESTAYAFDGFLPTGETISGTVAGDVTRTFDDDFEVTSESVNGSHAVGFVRDDDGLLTGAGALGLDRDPLNGLLTGATLDQVVTTIDHDAFGEPELVDSTHGASTVYGESYVRDDLGRITGKVETRGVQTTTYGYAYDDAGRLETVTKDGVTAATYSYDGNGNRSGVTRHGQLPIAAQYDVQDRMTTYGVATFAYDASGQLESKTDGSQVTTYEYDDLGSLMEVVLPNGDDIDYAVDGDGRRIAKKRNGALEQGFLYGRGMGPLAELNPNGTVKSRFVYATRANVPDYMVRGGQTYRILVDHVGSPRAVVDASTGAVAQEMDFDEFGRVTRDTNPGFQPFGFAGGLYDADTGLVRFGARDYDPETGRWTAKDPIGFQGGDPNLYGYVLGDPVNWVDPTGLFLDAIANAIDSVTPDYGSNVAAGLIDGATAGGASALFDTEGACWGAGYGLGGAASTAVPALGVVGRVARVLPHPRALGPHTSFKREPLSGRISGYTEFNESGRAVRRFRGTGGPGHGGVGPPVMYTPAKPGARPKVPSAPEPDDIPLGY